MSAPTPDSLYLWARLQAARLRALFVSTTRAERVLLLAVLLSIVQGILLDVLDDGHLWTVVANAVIVALLSLPVVADGILQRENVRKAGAAMIKLNREKPTGAPRVAEVVCIHGDHHRYVYGKSGWEAAGPAVDHRPAPEEVPAP